MQIPKAAKYSAEGVAIKCIFTPPHTKAYYEQVRKNFVTWYTWLCLTKSDALPYGPF